MSLLTKSSFIHFLECPIWLWLEKAHPELLPPFDEATKRLFAQGNIIDNLARQMYPGGVEVQDYNLTGFKNTLAAIEAGAKVLYQPTAVGDGLSARGDILVKGRSGVWDIHEVKMSTKVDEKESRHVSDLAFQRIAFERAGIPIGRTYLMHVDNTYVRKGDVDVSRLLIEEDITKDVKKMTSTVEEQIPAAKKVFAWPRELSWKHLMSCPDLSKCEYIGFWLNALKPRARQDLLSDLEPSLAAQVLEMNSTCVEGISDKFLASIAYQTPEERWPRSVDKAAIKVDLAKLEYPIAFYDYETYASAVPAFDGYRPYQQIPFQFSAYVIDAPGAKPRTFDFLADTFSDPALQVIAALHEIMPEKGTVVSWNDTFENHRNDELAKAHPKDAKFLLGINKRTYDLMLIFRHKLVVDPGFRGSASLKAVLPTLIPSLSYKDLAIQEGQSAAASWSVLTGPTLAPAARAKLRKDMIAYCQRDVLAMVKIWELLSKIK